jgi:hypothetical protein
LPALAGQRDLRAVIDVGGVATKCLRAALRELAETPEPLHFRLLVHDNSLAIGASGSTRPGVAGRGWYRSRDERCHSYASELKIQPTIVGEANATTMSEKYVTSRVPW